MPDPSIERFYRVVSVAYEHLKERQQEINDLNVFPVPDGDTGDNMVGTIRAVLDGLDGLRSNSLAAVDRNYIVQTVAHSALMGARGNSGVILSQIVRGAAEAVSHRRELIGPSLLRDGLASAADAAWLSVGDPQEGTMLTVIREIHSAVAARVEEVERAELDPDTDDAAQDAVLAELLLIAVQAGQEAVERTPEQLDVLAEAGVVDAGAYGLVVILAGLVAGLAGGEAGPSPLPHQAPATIHPSGGHADSRFRYCTSCILTGRALDPRAIAPRLEELGDSIAVVGDETMLKVHVHTDAPSRARAICAEHGDVHQFEFTDMNRQIAERDVRLSGGSGARTGLVVVASGSGIAELFAAEGARVVDGGATLNPSIHEILEGIRATPGDEVVVLPNSANVVMAAEEAGRLADRPVRVVASRSQQAGLTALVGGFDPAAGGEENLARMTEELEAISEGLVAAADRDDPDGRYRRGEAVGFVGRDLIAWGEPQPTLNAVVARLAEGAEIVTVLEGEGVPLHAADLSFDLGNGAEVEVHEGGQPTWWWLLAAQ